MSRQGAMGGGASHAGGHRGVGPRGQALRGGGGMSRRYRPRALYIWLALLTFSAVFAATD